MTSHLTTIFSQPVWGEGKEGEPKGGGGGGGGGVSFYSEKLLLLSKFFDDLDSGSR